MKIRDESDLPPHITYDEYQSLINEITNNPYNHYLNKQTLRMSLMIMQNIINL